MSSQDSYPPVLHASAPSTLDLLSGLAVETVRATVTDVISQYRQVHAETEDGRGLTLTGRTEGVDVAMLHRGQHIECVVTLLQPRVLRVQIVAQRRPCPRSATPTSAMDHRTS